MPRNLEHHLYTEIHRLKQRQKTHRIKKLGFLLLLEIVLGFLYWTRDQSPIPPSVLPLTEPKISPLPLPQSGTLTTTTPENSTFGELRIFLSPPTTADESTLGNRCPAKSLLKNDRNYFLKVVDWKSNQTVLTAFIRAGEKVVLSIPPGAYKLKYASGEQWYGENSLFGAKTQYGEVSDAITSLPLQFKFESNSTGWDLGLYNCYSGGNTTTKDLNPKDF